jgi:hypothetical protein
MIEVVHLISSVTIARHSAREYDYMTRQVSSLQNYLFPEIAINQRMLEMQSNRNIHHKSI